LGFFFFTGISIEISDRNYRYYNKLVEFILIIIDAQNTLFVPTYNLFYAVIFWYQSDALATLIASQ